MKCQPWMDATPITRRTPREQAKDDMDSWRKRMAEHRTAYDAARDEYLEAVERFNRASNEL